MQCHPVCLYLSLFGDSLHIVHLDGLALAEDLSLHLVIVLVPLLDLEEFPHVLVGRGVQVGEVALEQIAVDRVSERHRHVDWWRLSLLTGDCGHRGTLRFIVLSAWW